jgi:uncharacterized YccA/Bax inhibitor family protein
MRSGNPVLRPDVYYNTTTAAHDAMSISGVVNKAGILVGIVVFVASWVWSKFMQGAAVNMGGYLAFGGLVGFVLALIISFNPSAARVLAPIYAVCEGLFLGGVSSLFEIHYPGIVMQAVGLSFAVFFSMLFLYKSRIIKVTSGFVMGVFAATSGIALFYLAAMVLGFFHIQMPMVYSSSLLGIGFSVFVVIVAALNLVLDFHFIEEMSYRGASKSMEWYSAFALLVSLVWLYMEILRLLSKLNDRN